MNDLNGIDSQPTGLRAWHTFSLAALGFKLSLQIAEMIGNTILCPLVISIGTRFPPVFAGEVRLGLFRASRRSGSVLGRGGEHYEIKE